MRNKTATRQFYARLRFAEVADFPGYLILQRDQIEIHFFDFHTLDPEQNDGQVYIRTNNIQQLYQQIQAQGVAIHPAGSLAQKPWGQWEFSLLDPDNNLLTFGQAG